MSETRPTRFTELDGLRGIAALAVVLSHYTGGYNSRYVGAEKAIFDFHIGAFGVQLFFLISGFVILMSAQNSRRVSDFVISRASRLYPAYWISLSVVLAVSILFVVPKVEISPLIVAGNLTMIQRWLFIPNVNDVYWTLAIEMQFYLIMIVLLLVTKANPSTRFIQYFVYFWLILSLTVSVFAGPYSRGIDPQNVVFPVRIILNLTLSEFGPLFCLGMFAYLARIHAQSYWLLCFPLIVAVVNAGLLHDLWYSFVVAVICLAFLVVVYRERTKFLTIKPMLFYGKISYSMYIIHSIPGYIVITLTIPFLGRDWSMLAAFIIVTLLAWGLHSLGEVRGSRLMKSLLLRIRDGKPT